MRTSRHQDWTGTPFAEGHGKFCGITADLDSETRGDSREIVRQIAGLPEVKMADACWGSRERGSYGDART